MSAAVAAMRLPRTSTSSGVPTAAWGPAAGTLALGGPRGGAVDPGESYAEAARRELWEEVGLDRDCGPEVARRIAEFRTFEGVEVTADERYFRLDIDAHAVSAGALTALEQQVLDRWHWFTPAEIAACEEALYPADLVEMLAATAPG